FGMLYDLTLDQYREAFNDLTGRGYRPIHIDSYAAPVGLRYTVIWHRSAAPPPYLARQELSAGQFQVEFDEASANGFHLLDLSVADGGVFSAIFEKREGPPLQTTIGLNSAAFATKAEQLQTDGFRLVDIDGYSEAGETRFAGIWTKNDGRVWSAS